MDDFKHLLDLLLLINQFKITGEIYVPRTGYQIVVNGRHQQYMTPVLLLYKTLVNRHHQQFYIYFTCNSVEIITSIN